MSGWIKLHRSLLEWEWYGNKNARLLLIHLLVSVNHEDKNWHGVTIKAGSMAFSWQTLSKAVGLTVKECRAAMTKLEKNGSEVVRERAGNFQLVTLVKWDKLQEVEKVRAGKGQANGQLVGRERATTKEYKNIEERKKLFYEQVGKFASQYQKDLLRAFFDYWTEVNKKGDKLRFEDQKYFEIGKRLATWSRNNKDKYGSGNSKESGKSMMDSLKTI